MESPINPNVWKVLFNGGIAALSLASLFSLYHERYDLLSSMDADFGKVNEAKSDEESEKAIAAIISKIKGEPAQKRGMTRLSAQRHGSTLVRLASLRKDGSNADTVDTAIKAITTVFGVDAEGHRKLYMLGGYRTLLTTLSEAHRQGRQPLLEEAAQALYTLTRVDDAEVVLDTDVPMGAEGAYALARSPAAVKMLRVLNPQSPAAFLNSLTGIFANVCALRVGAQAIGRGLDGHSGISYFLQLLSHNSQGVVKNAVLTIRYLVRAGVGHEELAEEKNVCRLCENFSIDSDPIVTNSVLSVLLVMLDSKNRSSFFSNLTEKTNILSTLFEIWCRAPEKVLRDRVEMIVQLLLQVPECAEKIRAFLERYRAQISERRLKDEEARRKQLTQMRQSQMMQQMMMMENMGLGGGMDLGAMMGSDMDY